MWDEEGGIERIPLSLHVFLSVCLLSFGLFTSLYGKEEDNALLPTKQNTNTLPPLLPLLRSLPIPPLLPSLGTGYIELLVQLMKQLITLLNPTKPSLMKQLITLLNLPTLANLLTVPPLLFLPETS